jgi:hypothetical protein
MKYNINSIKSISPTYTSDGYVGSCAIDPDIKINSRIGGAGSRWRTRRSKSYNIFLKN